MFKWTYLYQPGITGLGLFHLDGANLQMPTTLFHLKKCIETRCNLCYGKLRFSVLVTGQMSNGVKVASKDRDGLGGRGGGGGLVVQHTHILT